MVKKILLVVALSVLSAGCANLNMGGNADKFSPAFLQANLINKKTTGEDVIKIFGQPDSKSADASGHETWVYKKNSGFDLLSAAASVLPIPGASEASSVNDAMNSQKKGGYGDTLFIWVDKGVVTNWHM